MTDYAAAPALLAAAQETIRQLADENAALLAANTRLRGERDRARDLAVRSGIFEEARPGPWLVVRSGLHDGGES